VYPALRGGEGRGREEGERREVRGRGGETRGKGKERAMSPPSIWRMFTPMPRMLSRPSNFLKVDDEGIPYGPTVPTNTYNGGHAP